MIQTLSLSMAGNFSDQEIYGVQSDKDLSQVRCILRGYRYQAGDTALLRATKPDETVCYLSGVYENENIFRFVLTKQITAVAGDVRCDVSLCRGTGTISSDQFILKVRPPSAAGAMSASESEYIGFPDLILNTVNAEEITLREIDTMWKEAEA